MQISHPTPTGQKLPNGGMAPVSVNHRWLPLETGSVHERLEQNSSREWHAENFFCALSVGESQIIVGDFALLQLLYNGRQFFSLSHSHFFVKVTLDCVLTVEAAKIL